MTTAERVAKFRARKKEAGLYEVRGIYISQKFHTQVKEYAKKLQKRQKET